MSKLFLLSLLVITAGCSGTMSWVAWRGYNDPIETPPPGSYKLVEGDCFSIGVQNLNQKQEAAIMEAAGHVCRVINSEKFRSRVLSQEWMASCDLDSDGNKDIIDGKDVLNIMSSGIPNFSVNPKKPWLAIAQAQKSENNHTKNRMAIKPARIEAWHSTDKKGLLVNTIAHEATHLISFSFRDRGHGTTECPDSNLVSYGIGNLVEELAMQ